MAYDLSAAQVDTLLEKLTNDEAFHAAFAADPAAALASIGLPTTLAECVSNASLASQADIAAGMASIQALLTDPTLSSQHIHELAAQ